MPFLKDFFENPVLGKLFGETELAAAIREMKAIDPMFRLMELHEMIEHVVAPHLVTCYLNGNLEALQLQCSEGAFAAFSHSIKERNQLKLTLDPSILYIRNVTLQGASRSHDVTPWFIFTFTVQQINCLRNDKSEVVSGAIDDIRDVIYSIAVTKHPNPETQGLHYPWMVREMAIVGNTASF